MELQPIKMLLAKLPECALATMNTTTCPSPGVRKVTKGMQVLLFSKANGDSGYEALVKQRLAEAGKDPSDFSVGDLPWGERVGNSPLIYCRGVYYLQTIVLQPGQSVGYLGNSEVNLADFERPQRTNQGLPREDEVIVKAFKLSNIDSIAVMGEAVTSEGCMPIPLIINAKTPVI